MAYSEKQNKGPLPVNRGGYKPSPRGTPSQSGKQSNAASCPETTSQNGALKAGAAKTYVTRPNPVRNGAR